MIRAIAYVRMASQEQVDHYEIGNFPQDKTIKNYCYLNNIILLETFCDIGVSSSNFDRKGWSEMEEFLSQCAVDLVIVTDYDRIGRDKQQVLTKMAEIEGNYGPSFMVLSDPIIPSSNDIAGLFNT